MADEKLFSYLFFKKKEVNGKEVPGKFETLKVRFLYSSLENIPMGRVHLYNYAPKKVTRVLCLHNGETNKQVEASKVECPMCKVAQYGTPSNKYFGFVSDLNDDGALKLFEFNYSMGKQLDEIAEIKGKPLHDIVFTLSKKGQGKDTTFTPMFEEVSAFNVKEYFSLLGISDYPKIVGAVGDKAPILALSKEQMTEFVNGKYPWSTGDGDYTPRKTTVLGATVTLRGEDTKADFSAEGGEDVKDIDENVEIVDDEDSSSSSFF